MKSLKHNYSIQHSPMHVAIACMMIFLVAQSASSQEILRTRFGLFGQVALNRHNADFLRIPETESCCLGFTGGNGTGFGTGALVELPLGESLLLGGRLSFLAHPFSMTTPELTYIITSSGGGVGSFEHRLTGSLATLGLEPMVAYRPFGSLLLQAGVRAGIPLSSSYEQKEQLVQPSGAGTFQSADGSDSHTRTRNVFSGALPSPGVQIAPVVGVSYELPINAQGTLLLAPEVSYQFGLTNVIADLDWKINVLRAGIALKYSPLPGKRNIRERKEVIDTVRVIASAAGAEYARGMETSSESESETDDLILTTETVRRTDTLFEEPKPMLQALVTASGVEADGTELPVMRLRVEEFSSTLMTPLLHYVFFEENSAGIPDRYNSLRRDETERFNIDRINSPDRLPTYHHLLNIVGRRMLDYPKATITLTGCNQDIREEKGNVALSRQRAEAVKRYLMETWGIADGRIRLEARNLPSMAANTLTADGSEENRRVEITSSDWHILEPIITNDTLRRANPPGLRFRPTAAADAGLASWELIARQQGEVLSRFEGRDSIPSTLDWNVEREHASIPRYDADITYTLAVTDSRGSRAESRGMLPVEQVTIRKKRTERRGDKEINRFSLILFEVRSADLMPAHTPIIALIKNYIKPASTVTVTGYTDRLGQTKYNQQLAENRAAAVTKALGRGTAESKGVGQADLFNSDLPEGRLYTRTVDVVVETPVVE